MKNILEEAREAAELYWEKVNETANAKEESQLALAGILIGLHLDSERELTVIGVGQRPNHKGQSVVGIQCGRRGTF